MREFIVENLTSAETISFAVIVLNNLVAMAAAFFVMLAYKVTYSGTAYSRKFNISLGAITIITTMIMSVISNNIALSLGMVGALSIVRFRTAVKEPRDIAFLFWAIAIGLTCGSEMYLIGLLGSLVLTVVVCLAGLDLYDTTTYLLVLRAVPESVEEKALCEVLKKNARSYKLRMRNQTADSEEFTYELSFTRKQNAAALTALVRQTVGAEKVRSLNLVSYSGETL